MLQDSENDTNESAIVQSVPDKIRTIQMEPSTMHRICEHVSNGGSLLELCALWGVPYGALITWVNENDERSKLYDRALQAQLYWGIDRVLDELKSIATVDISEAYTKHNTLKPLHEIPESVRRAIVAIETEELFDGVGKERNMIGYTKRVRLADKIKSLELMGKKFAMWIERRQIDTSKSLEDLIAESLAEPKADVEE